MDDRFLILTHLFAHFYCPATFSTTAYLPLHARLYTPSLPFFSPCWRFATPTTPFTPHCLPYATAAHLPHTTTCLLYTLPVATYHYTTHLPPPALSRTHTLFLHTCPAFPFTHAHTVCAYYTPLPLLFTRACHLPHALPYLSCLAIGYFLACLVCKLSASLPACIPHHYPQHPLPFTSAHLPTPAALPAFMPATL